MQKQRYFLSRNESSSVSSLGDRSWEIITILFDTFVV
jgi:hypothetical protein